MPRSNSCAASGYQPRSASNALKDRLLAKSSPGKDEPDPRSDDNWSEETWVDPPHPED